MGWSTLADMALQASIGTFKTAATYTMASSAGSPVAINGVYSAPGVQVDPETGVAVQSVTPTFGIRLADLPAAPGPGDTVTIGTTVYRVARSDVDGQGGASLSLNRNG